MSAADLHDHPTHRTTEEFEMGARHEIDVVSLVSGLLIVLLAGLFLVDDLSSVSVDARWVAPLVLLGVGAGGLLASLRTRQD